MNPVPNKAFIYLSLALSIEILGWGTKIVAARSVSLVLRTEVTKGIWPCSENAHASYPGPFSFPEPPRSRNPVKDILRPVVLGTRTLFYHQWVPRSSVQLQIREAPGEMIRDWTGKMLNWVIIIKKAFYFEILITDFLYAGEKDHCQACCGN